MEYMRPRRVPNFTTPSDEALGVLEGLERLAEANALTLPKFLAKTDLSAAAIRRMLSCVDNSFEPA